MYLMSHVTSPQPLCEFNLERGQNSKTFPKFAAPGVHVPFPIYSVTHPSRCCCEGILQMQLKSESVDLKIGRFSDFIT